MSEVRYRCLVLTDSSRVHAINRWCFGAAPDSLWCLRSFLAVPGNGGLVAELDGRVVGFLLYKLEFQPPRATILRLVVLPRYRRRLIGTRLLSALQQRLDIPDLEIVAHVVEADLQFQLFLRRNYFKAVRILRASEGGRAEDVYLFRYEGP